MKTSINTCYATVLVAAVAAFASVPALACSDHGPRYEAPTPTKPVVEFGALSDAQFAELDAYAKALQEKVAAIHDEESKFDYSQMDEKAKSAKKKEFDNRVQQVVEQLSDTVSFQTKITVGNGMLCGAAIEVLLPPAPNNIEIGWDGLWTYGKGKTGNREQGVIYMSFLRKQLAGLRNPKSN